MKKRIIISAVITVLLLCIIFIKPISLYFTVLRNGYNPTQIEYYKIIEETQQGKTSIYIANTKGENFNLILLSDVNSFTWYMQKIGVAATEAKPYSWIKWDEWFLKEKGKIDIGSRTHETIILKKESKIQIDTDKIPSSLKWEKSQLKEFTIVDIYTKTEATKELDDLDITELIHEK